MNGSMNRCISRKRHKKERLYETFVSNKNNLFKVFFAQIPKNSIEKGWRCSRKDHMNANNVPVPLDLIFFT